MKYAVPMLLLLFAGLACRGDRPARDRPWVVVLDETVGKQQALAARDTLAARLSGKLEPKVLSLELSGLRRYLVASPGFASAEEARRLANELCAGRGCRLRLLDTSGARWLEEAAGGTSLEGLEPFEQLAALLPSPPEAALESLELFAATAEAVACPERTLGHHLSQGWCRLGFRRLASVEWRFGQPPAAVQVLLGMESGKSAAELLADSVRLLRAQTALSDEQWQAKQKAARAARQSRRGKKQAATVLPAGPEASEPPAPEKRLLPWGEGPVYRFERICLKPPEKYKPGDSLQVAWLIPLAQEGGAMLALSENEERLREALAPVGLGEARGVRFQGDLLRALALLPEGLSEGERLEEISLSPAATWLGSVGRAAGAARAVRLRFAGRGFFWRITHIELPGAAEAQKLFESGFVEPRRIEIQKLLDSRQKLNYEVGLQLVEIGDVSGWLRKGTAAGRGEELYFQKGNSVWWLEAEGLSAAEAEGAGLIGRAGLLPLW